MRWMVASVMVVLWLVAPVGAAPLAVGYARDEVVVYAGPGDTFQREAVLHDGVLVQVIERSRLGNWVRVMRAVEGVTVMDGWALTGSLVYSASFQLGDVPVAAEEPLADWARLPDESLAALYQVPVIPTLDEAMTMIYQVGQSFGNNPQSVTKVGDSVVANRLYLNIFSQSDYDLGPYGFLAETLAYYAPSTHNNSVAARLGMSSFSVLDPAWADRDACLPAETPLECEFRLKKPSVVMIMFGPNDLRALDAERYDQQMRLIVEASLNKGVIPVLWLFAYDTAHELWPKALAFQQALIAIAADYRVPLVNLWAASRPLPRYGLEGDDIHLRNSGYTFLKFSGGEEARFGVTLQNLLALRMLDEIRQMVAEDQ